MNNTPLANYTIVYQAVGRRYDQPLVSDIMLTFNQVQINHQSDSQQTTLTFSLTGDARAAIVDICYKHLSDIAFQVQIAETIASHALPAPTP